MKIEVRAHSGKISIDASSDKTMGLSHVFVGDTLISCFGEKVRIAGVASATRCGKFFGQEVIWYTKEDDITYYYAPGDLFNLGFKTIKEGGCNEKTDECF
ncbi:MAG: hypothetical protein Q7U36_03840 [bacterium]|nr:hypothetical protein [bacterium]